MPGSTFFKGLGHVHPVMQYEHGAALAELKVQLSFNQLLGNTSRVSWMIERYILDKIYQRSDVGNYILLDTGSNIIKVDIPLFMGIILLLEEVRRQTINHSHTPDFLLKS